MGIFRTKKLELPKMPEGKPKEEYDGHDTRLLASKIDTLSAKLDLIDEKIKRIEMILNSWQQQSTKQQGQSYQQL